MSLNEQPRSDGSQYAGLRLNQRFEVRSLVWEGEQCLIFDATELASGRRVALKALRDAWSSDVRWQRRIRDEANALRLLADAPVPQLCSEVWNLGGGDLGVGFAMEWLSGQTFDAYVKRQIDAGLALSVSEVQRYLAPVVDALQRAHAQGIVHRDVKPSNVWLRDTGETRLIDFGLAQFRNQPRPSEEHWAVGTLSYVAPECWYVEWDEVDARADQYSFGALVFWAFTGEPPFVGSARSLATQTRLSSRPSLRARRRDLPRKLDVWLQRALAAEPKQRFADMRALWREFESACRDETR